MCGGRRRQACDMPCFLLHHRHEPDECGVVFASFRGHESSLRRQPTIASCRTGGHAIWWQVEADSEARRPCAAAVLRRSAHHGHEGQRGDDPMNTHRESWTELASREADGLVVSLLWSRGREPREGRRGRHEDCSGSSSSQSRPRARSTPSATRSSTPAPRSRSRRRRTRRRSPLDRPPRAHQRTTARPAPTPKPGSEGNGVPYRLHTRSAPRRRGASPPPGTSKSLTHIPRRSEMFRKTHTRSTKPAEPIGDAFKSNNIAGPHGPLECKSLEDRRVRLARFVVAAFADEHLLPDAADRAERRRCRRVPQGRTRSSTSRSTSTRPGSSSSCSSSRRRRPSTILPSAPRSTSRLTVLQGFPKVEKLRSPLAAGNDRARSRPTGTRR